MNIASWITESNRMKHLVGIALVAIVTFAMLGLLYVSVTWQHFIIAAFVCAAVASAMEFKDVHHANGDHVPFKYWDWSSWDWLDIAAGMLGYLAVAIIYLVLCLII